MTICQCDKCKRFTKKEKMIQRGELYYHPKCYVMAMGIAFGENYKMTLIEYLQFWIFRKLEKTVAIDLSNQAL